MNYVIVFAGGVGKRMGIDTPKQFLIVNNKPILIYTLEKFSNCMKIDGIILVSLDNYINYCEDLIDRFNISKILKVVSGGNTSQESIFNGLKYLIDNHNISNDDIVLIHDGVRPLINNKLIINNIECVKKYGNCITSVKAIETIIKVNNDKLVTDIIDRNLCQYARAPQSFYLNEIYNIHLKAIKDNKQNIAIDSATLMTMYNIKLHTIECNQENIKITTLNDYYMFKGMIENGYCDEK